MASVPNTSLVYPLLGRPQDSLGGIDHTYNVSFPTYLGAKFDASTTNLTYLIPAPAGAESKDPLNLVISFLSPITPTSTIRQSVPASYIEITATGPFDVDIYMDMNGQWVTAERNTDIVWDFGDISHKDGSSLNAFRVHRKDEMKFAEIDDRAEYGKLYFVGPPNSTYQVGTSAVLRKIFARKGSLENHIDNYFRAVMDEEPVFAFQKSLVSRGKNSTEGRSCLFTVAHIRDEVAQYAAARGLTQMKPLWKSQFLTDHEVLDWHYHDYRTAKKLADEFSARVTHDAGAVGGQDHIDIVSLSARQVLGATDFTGTQEDPLLFMKEISSDGNCQTIDVIFPSFPFFAYANPKWLAYTLEPLLEHMLSGQYPNKYAMHDLGSSYPNLTGHADGNDEYMPVEESGDMLIMGLWLVQSMVEGFTTKLSDMVNPFTTTKDVETEYPEGRGIFALDFEEDREDRVIGIEKPHVRSEKSTFQAKAWLTKTYRLWEQWTEYLIEFSLEPENQLSTDDFAGWLRLQTNLALKGIVGIKAMGELAAVMGKHDEYKSYKNISDTYITKWQEFGISRDGTHAKLAYDWYGSWTTLYSLFADAVLCFHKDSSIAADQLPAALSSGAQVPLLKKNGSTSDIFIPHGIYKNQSKYYTDVLQKYGLPLDSRHLYSKSDWQFQVAAAASPDLRREIVARVARWLNETETTTPFSDLYKTEEKGGYADGTRFTARPVIGSHFSLMVMDTSCGGSAIQKEWDE